MTIALALARLQAGDRAGALAHLCDAWRAVRDPALATTIETLGATLPIQRPAGKTIAEKQKAFTALAKRATAAELGGLVASLTDIAKAEPLRERIWRISECPHDPRIASALLAMLFKPPIPGGTFRHPAIAAGNALVELADVRQLAALDRFAAEDNPRTLASFGGRLTELRSKLRAQVAKHAIALSPDDRALLATIDAALAAAVVAPHPDSDVLFAAVYANPEDDGPRLVLADELQRRGDPRGELMALQLARGRDGSRTKRERELLAAAGRDWLGVLEPVIAKTGVVFERGFLSKCTLRDASFAGLADRPEWRTIEDLDLAGAWSAFRVIPIAAMPGLRSLRNGAASALPRSAPHLVHLELRHADPSSFTELMQRDLPALRHLAITGWVEFSFSEIAELCASPLARQLESFAIAPIHLDRWLPAAFDAPFARLSLTHGPWTVTAADDSASLRRARTPRDIETFDSLPELLHRIPHDRFSRVEVTVPTDEELPAAVASELDRFAISEVHRREP